MTLTKADLVRCTGHLCGFPRSRAIQAVETTLEIVKSTLESGESVLISGFGKFEVKDKNRRRGRNPQTGDDLMLRPRRVIMFSCSGVLREELNGKS